MWNEEDEWRGESLLHRLLRNRSFLFGISIFTLLAAHRVYHFFRSMNRRLITLEAILLDQSHPPPHHN